MKKSIDFQLVEPPPGDDDLPPMSWIVGVADVFEDAVPRVFLVLEEQGQAGYGQTVHLDATQARAVRAAIATALREMGEESGA
jgi:hypothetical protein